METSVVVEQQRTQYESRGRSHGLCGRYGGSSAGSGGCYRELNCIGYHHYGAAGLLPTPLKKARSSSVAAPLARSPSTPRSVLPSARSSSEVCKLVKTCPRSAPISIKSRAANCSFRFDEFAYAELWAGPAYSHSPPPSSVPIPKFSTRGTPTRTVSLELPVIAREEIELHLHAKSAPVSPRELEFFGRDLFGTADNATRALRRILNLDTTD